MYIFGPVPSRRLGLSLGIDLLAGKSCNLNCIYCELGRSFKLVSKRGVFVKTADVIAEIKEFFDKGGNTDYVTISGSGEPTLALNLGEVISEIKKITDKKIAVITNGVLLSDKNVRKDLMAADVVLPSLDAVTKETFIKINRPHKSITAEKVVKGLKDFAKEYKGEIWLEIMVVKGFNDNEKEILAIKKVIDSIPRIKSIQLNTVVRSRAEESAEPVDAVKLEALRAVLGPKAEVIGNYKGDKLKTIDNIEDAMFDAILRRPMTIEDFVQSLNIQKKDIEKHIKNLVGHGKIIKEVFGDKEFYKSTGKQL